MRTVVRPFCLAVVSVIALPALAAAQRPAGSADPVAVSPDVYSVRLENDQVRVLEMRLKPGQRDRAHGHPAEAVLFLNAGKARLTLPDGQTVEKDIAAREEMFNGAWAHAVENIGSTDIHALIVELKGAAPAPAPGGADPVVVSSKQYRKTIDNPQLRTLMLTLGPGERDEMHAHPGYAAYFLTPGSLKFAFPDGKSGARDLTAGEVLWSPPTAHQVENAGKANTEVWIVEIKRRP